MPRLLNVSLALLFVGLQIASLLHGAHFGFQSHDHDRIVENTLVVSAQLVGVMDLNEPENHGEDHSQARCDVVVFCEKLDKWSGVDGPVLSVSFYSMPATRFFLQSLSPERVKNVYARGPPVSLLS